MRRNGLQASSLGSQVDYYADMSKGPAAAVKTIGGPVARGGEADIQAAPGRAVEGDWRRTGSRSTKAKVVAAAAAAMALQTVVKVTARRG